MKKRQSIDENANHLKRISKPRDSLELQKQHAINRINDVSYVVHSDTTCDILGSQSTEGEGTRAEEVQSASSEEFRGDREATARIKWTYC